MRDVSVIGVGITKFGKRDDVSMRELGLAATRAAIADSKLDESAIDLVVHGNAMEGALTGQEMIRGEIVMGDTALVGKPMLNVENACATSSSALHVALAGIRSGMYDTALVCGTEKMTGVDKRRTLDALMSGTDLSRLEQYTYELTGREGPAESFFMEVYSKMTRDYMDRTGARAEDFAQVAAKNSRHGALNPNAQYRTARTVEEVLASRMIADPVTMLMCSPVADGAAALVLQADDVRRDGAEAVRIRASQLATAVPGGGGKTIEERAIDAAYEEAAIGPEDLDVVELHDAAAPNELIVYEELRLCEPGGAAALLASGATELGGRVPVNPSGGLVSRGHPVGATGCAQIVELVTQLRGRAGERQVEGAAIGIAENAGGYIHPESAACVVTVLSKN